MKTKIQIFKGKELIAESYINSKKEEESFINTHFPKMKMTTQVKEKWTIFRGEVKMLTKNIDIPMEIVQDLKILAIKENKDLKNFIQDLLIDLVKK